jgi:haloalkane dehalogenase
MNPASFSYLEIAMKQPGALEALQIKPAMGVIDEEDATTPTVMAEDLLRVIWPGAPFITLPNARHFAQEDAPETLVAMIEQFVASTSPRLGTTTSRFR